MAHDFTLYEKNNLGRKKTQTRLGKSKHSGQGMYTLLND